MLKLLRATGMIVILDTPPARWSADAISLAGAADAALLVVRSGRASTKSIREVAEGLRREGLRTLGSLLLGSKTPKLTRLIRYGHYASQEGYSESITARVRSVPAPPDGGRQDPASLALPLRKNGEHPAEARPPARRRPSWCSTRRFRSGRARRRRAAGSRELGVPAMKGHVFVTGVAGFIGSHLAEALLPRATRWSGSTR